MTQPVQEPTQDRAVGGLRWQTNQLFRRPAPAGTSPGGTSQWQMSYDLLPRVMDASALDGAGNFFGTTVDLTYWTGFYWDNFGNPSTAYTTVRLGPQGSVWGINIAAERNTDCGVLKFAFASVSEDSPGQGYDLDGLGMIPGSTEPDFPSTFYNTSSFAAVDLYGAADKNKLWSGAYSQFRLMGADGDPLTANGVFSVADNVDHFDGGSGLYVVRLLVDSKNGSSSGYRTPITFARLTRFTADGFPTS